MERKFLGINLRQDDFIYPYFVRGGARRKERIKLFPGVYRFSVDSLLEDLEETLKLGIKKVLLFGVPRKKDSRGSSAYAKNNIVAQAVKEIKKEFPELTVMTDVCLCAYTSHGHCGMLRTQDTRHKTPEYIIDNDETLKVLAKIALSHAQAGADYVAPSAMAKGQVGAIRQRLDQSGFQNTKIMGYSAKFASQFYGPFRNAADSSARFGDRSSYQLNYLDSQAAIKEIEEDIREGADIVMVKPALTYLDIIKEASLRFDYPLAAYNVSGEYALVKAGVKVGLWDEKETTLEILTSIKRAGADLIISYHAKEVGRWLRDI